MEIACREIEPSMKTAGCKEVVIGRMSRLHANCKEKLVVKQSIADCERELDMRSFGCEESMLSVRWR